jgi:surface carbohydrate biosynthesis protein
MKKINILLPVETIDRELDCKLFLAASLVNKNINVIIAQHDYFNSSCDKFKGGVYIGKNIFKSHFPQSELEKPIDLSFYENLKVNDISLFHLDEEGGIIPGDEDGWRQGLDFRLNPGILSDDDYIFTWGSFQKEHYESKDSSLPESNFIACGHPKFELCKPRFRNYYKKSIEEIRARYGSFILINTNQGLANGLAGLERTLLDHVDKVCYTTKDEKLRLEFITWWAHQNKIISNFIVLIHSLSIAFPDKTFVVRPHPSEDPKFYRVILSILKNVHVDSAGAVHPWIMAADLIIHDGCTTAVEAFLAKVPVVNFKSTMNDPYEFKLPNQIGSRCESVDDVIRVINDLGDGCDSFAKKNSFSPLTASLLKNLESDIYDDFIDLCSKLIKNKLDANTYSGEISLSIMRLSEYGSSLVLCLRSVVRKFFPVKIIQYLVGRFHFPGFNRGSIDEKVQVIEHVINKKVSLKHLSSRLLIITSEEDGK